MTRRIIAVVCSAGLLATCGGRESPPANPTAPEPSIVSVRISGPSSMQPGESVQFSAIASLSDGTSRDVTGTAVWRVSNPSVFSVTGSGLVTALTTGDGSINVSYQGRGAGVFAISLPAGTGVLRGTVKEASFPIGGATIEIVGGLFAGRTAVSDAGGYYSLYGVVGDLQVRASRDGYVTVTTRVTVAPLSNPRRDQTLDLNLSSTSPTFSLAGTYRVTLTASTTCATRLPADLTVREYRGTVTQDGSRLTIVLSGPEFAVNLVGAPTNRFEGRVRSDAVELSLGSLYYYAYYDTWGFVERIRRPRIGAWGFADTNYLAVTGTASGQATQSDISATLNGAMGLYDASASFFGRRTLLSTCSARDHRLVLTRQ